MAARAAAATVAVLTAEWSVAAAAAEVRPAAPLEVAGAEGETAAAPVAVACAAAVAMGEAAKVVAGTVEGAAAVAADLDRTPLWCCMQVVCSERTESPVQPLAARKGPP